MAYYTYDEEADALYVLLVEESDVAIHGTVALSDRLHVDVDSSGRAVGVEILSPRKGNIDFDGVRERFGVVIRLPFTFAA